MKIVLSGCISDLILKNSFSFSVVSSFLKSLSKCRLAEKSAKPVPSFRVKQPACESTDIVQVVLDVYCFLQKHLESNEPLGKRLITSLSNTLVSCFLPHPLWLGDVAVIWFCSHCAGAALLSIVWNICCPRRNWCFHFSLSHNPFCQHAHGGCFFFPLLSAR